MTTIILYLIYEHDKIQIQANENDSFNKIIQKFSTKTKIDLNNKIFEYNGKIINNNEIIKNIMSDRDKRDKIMTILVEDL